MGRADNLAIKRSITVMLAFTVLLGCVFTDPKPTQAATGKITLGSSSKMLYIGETYKVPVKRVTGLSNKNVTYSSSKKKVALVSSNGVITPKKVGRATITVTSAANRKVKATLKVTVKARPAKSSITLPKKSTSLNIGKTYAIKVKSVKGLSDKSVTYKSNNSKVASVTKKGVVKGKKAGTAVITVTSAVNKKVTAKFKVTVKKASVPAQNVSMQAPFAITLKLYSGTNIPVTVTPANTKLVLSTSDSSIVSVYNDKQAILGVGVGSATVTVKTKDGSASKKIKVTVKKNMNQIANIRIFSEKDKIYFGESMKLTAKVYPSNATNQTLYWKSTDPSIAEVTQDGTVIAKGVGNVEINAYATDGSGKKGYKSVEVASRQVNVTIEQYTRLNPDILEPGDEALGKYRLVGSRKEVVDEGKSIALGRYTDDDGKPDADGWYEQTSGDKDAVGGLPTYVWRWKDVKAKEGAVLKIYRTWNGNDDGSYK